MTGMQLAKRIGFGMVRVWLGYEWLSAGLGKVGNPAWTGDRAGSAVTGFLKGALAKATGDHPAVQGWYARFVEAVALPNAAVISYLVAWGEVLIGIGLLLGLATTAAALAGALMNLNFMLAGTTSTNPILYTAAVLVLAGGTASAYFGLDPAVKRWLAGHAGGWQRHLPKGWGGWRKRPAHR